MSDNIPNQKIKNQIGRVSGCLTVVSFSHVINGTPYWICLCECGHRPVIRSECLTKSGRSHCEKCKVSLTRPTYRQKTKERLLRGVKKTPNGCWEWVKGFDSNGYGNITVECKTQRVHIISYQLFVGLIPSGMCVCHTCDNPPCCNPDHLFLGTHRDNMNDMTKKGRRISGEKSTNSKLTQKQVNEIRKTYDPAQTTFRKMAENYNVTADTISRIVRGLSWRAVTTD